MKGLWKKIFVGTLLTTAVAGFSGCSCSKNRDNNISVDLDGDGVISEWETVFGSAETSDRIVNKVTVVNISSLAELKAINGKATDTAYVLTKNIDCGGETLAINIGASNYLYGNNKIIRNFKLGEAKIEDAADSTTIDNGLKEYLNSPAQVSVNCFLYNAGAIYDLRLFMGNQTFNPENDCTSFDASAINSVKFIDNVIIKGAINVKPKEDDAVKKFNLALGVVDHSGEHVEITNIEVQGKVSYEDSRPGRLNSDGLQISAIIPEVTSGSTVYNANAKANISVNSNAKMTVGLIAATNFGFISTSNGLGDIKTVYTDSSSLVVGGIVGHNEQLAETRNCTMTGKIDFTSNMDFAIANTLKTQARVGGIAGKNTAGVIDYCTSDAVMTGNNLTSLYIGGLCGEASRGIFNNVIARGSINLTSIDGLTMANLVGKMAYGMVEKAIVLTNINLDNTAFDFSKVNLGMVTVFEEGLKHSFTPEAPEGSEPKTIQFYDMIASEQATPEFAYILVGGTNDVYLRTEREHKNEFEYNLGLRNTYLYKAETELGDELLESYTPQMQMFHDLYYLNNYAVRKYEPVDNFKTLMKLDLTYPENAGSPKVRVVSDSVVYRPDWFAKYLYFNYGANHHEIDVSGVSDQTKEASLQTIKFAISEDMAKTKYFENEQYNEELARFDKKFDVVSTSTGANYDTEDELFSFLHYLVNKVELTSVEIQNGGRYMPLVFSRQFFAGQVVVEGENGSEMVEMFSVPLFVDRVTKALTQMNCVVEAKYYAIGNIECDVENEDLYRVRVAASSGRTSFVFTFDVREFVKKTAVTDSTGENCYIINLRYIENVSSSV